MFDSNVMDALVVNDLDRQSGTRFVTEFDAIPGFWNYLGSLDRTDLIAELIQNDLDQDATRTVISFGRTCLVCSGNGKPVEPDGWKRLRKIMGAGDEVPAKRSRFGVKNHGLKTAFTIGDEIRLLSAWPVYCSDALLEGAQYASSPRRVRSPDGRSPSAA